MEFYQYTLPDGALLQGYLREETTEMPAYNTRPAVIVLPGGGYEWRSKRESDPVAVAFMAMGYQVFLLDYKTTRDIGAPLNWTPLTEAAGAILHIRQNAARLHVDPQRIAICGFSAGAHLAACTAILWDAQPLRAALGVTGAEARPDAVILGYPVITTGAFAHRGSIENLAGQNPDLCARFSLENQVRAGLPPFFIWHTVADEAVPVENSLLLVNALQKCAVPYEYHLFTTGCHGMSTCTQEVNTPSAHNANWLPLCEQWLSLTFGYHI